MLLVAAAAMPRSDHALVVPTAFFAFRNHKGLDRLGARRQFGKVADGRPAASRRSRIVSSNSHDFILAVSIQHSAISLLKADRLAPITI